MEVVVEPSYQCEERDNIMNNVRGVVVDHKGEEAMYVEGNWLSKVYMSYKKEMMKDEMKEIVHKIRR